ncbi:ABC transporter permease [Jiella sp. MQZ9-1]|uniref:ABC transporter permease n=1 Tax=Jiella flava TaxID=2816857 RepID=A0A939FYD3_9HYPH|nr:ABC transporter permease [Jiella flava]MBO0664283.1 ABC transporter permease [Jiella flava]MCD2472794.1 ABC transporter permease [Jiella flava]
MTRELWMGRGARILPPVVLVAALVAIWGWSAATGLLPRWLLPGPGAVLHEFDVSRAVLLKHAQVTATEALGGCAIGSVLGVAAAMVMTLVAPLRQTLYAYALASRALPLIVFTPVLVIVVGRGIVPVMVIVSVTTYFPVFLGMMRGLERSNPDRMELLYSLSASPTQILWKVQLPSALPYLFAALKVAASTAFVNALVTEWIAANAGLGYLVMVSGQYFRLPLMWAAIFSAALMTLALLGLILLAERLAGRWTQQATEV